MFNDRNLVIINKLHLCLILRKNCQYNFLEPIETLTNVLVTKFCQRLSIHSQTYEFVKGVVAYILNRLIT